MNPSPEQLLRDFVHGPDAEAAFAKLVSKFEKLIYSSALRRTGNPPLAEDITQSVLTILARKAKSLLNHPSLTGWIFQTTKFETMKALRTEARRHKKHLSFQKESSIESNAHLSDHEHTLWQEALPRLDQSLDQLSQRDQDLILRRFFGQEKFQDIARATKSSEGACKMQLKRALERLESHLSTGRTLSISSLGTALTMSLASSPPAKAGTLLATQVLTQASAVKSTTLLTNTFLTMTTTQKTLTIAAILITATAVPAIQLVDEANRLQGEIHALNTQNHALKAQRSLTASTKITPTRKRIAYDVIQERKGPVDALALLEGLAQLESTANLTGILTLFLPVVDLNDEELTLLLNDLKDCESYPNEKETVLTLIAELRQARGILDPQTRIEEFLATDSATHSITPLLRTWASESPHEALAWFQEKDRHDAFLGKGTHDRRANIYANLIQGIYHSNPALASQLYREAEKNVRSIAALDFINQIERDIQSTGDTSSLEAFLSIEPDASIQQRATHRAAEIMSLKTQSLDEGLRVLQMAKGKGQNFPQALTLLAAQQKQLPFAQKFSWLEENLTQKQLKKNIPIIFSIDLVEVSEINQWFKQNQTSVFHDDARSAFAFELTRKGEFQAAREHAELIRSKGDKATLLDYIDRSQKKATTEAPVKTIEE